MLIKSDPLRCRCRFHSGACVVNTYSDGTVQHVETIKQPAGAFPTVVVKQHPRQ